MRAQKLFHHPVGVFSFGARWYLASLAVLMLILVAVHFVIHIQAQERARLLMHDWLAKAQVDVGQVRYHLLRNALTLQNIHIRRGDNSLSIAQILVRADAGSLTSDTPHMGDVKLSGVRAEIRDALTVGWQDDMALLRIWRTAETLRFDGGQLVLHLPGGDTPALEFDALGFEQHQQGDKTELHVSAELLGAPVSLDMSSAGQGHLTQHGRVEWQDIRAGAVLTALGWQPLNGFLSGKILFQAHGKRADDMHSSDFTWRGKLNLAREDDSFEHRLLIQGERQAGLWKLDMQALAWPLSPWVRALPAIHGMRLLSGEWQGNMQLSQSRTGWRGKSPAGAVKHMQWLAGQADDANMLEYLSYQKLVWDSVSRDVHMDTAALQELEFTLRTDSAATEGGWRLRVNEFKLLDADVALAMQRGTLIFAHMQGQGGIDRHGRLALNLASQDEADDLRAGHGHWSLN